MLTFVVHWLPMEELVYSKWGSITLYDLENDYIIPIIPGKLWNRQPVLTGVVQTQYLYIGLEFGV